jgi:hypothetical protein
MPAVQMICAILSDPLSHKASTTAVNGMMSSLAIWYKPTESAAMQS